jgi:glycosyltransferase involved in cell wall biosynthesis
MNLKIALISEHTSPFSTLGEIVNGGQNIYMAQIAKNLVKLGHQVDLFIRKDNEDAPDITNFEGARIIHVPAGPPKFLNKEALLPFMKDFTSFIKNFFSWQRIPYNLLHADHWLSGLVAADIKLETGIPFFITLNAQRKTNRAHREDSSGQFSDQRFEIERRIVQECDYLITECPQERKDFISLYHADSKKISTIPYGFDSTEFWPINRTEACQHTNIDPDQFVVLQLGSIAAHKGIDTVIDGFTYLKKKISRPANLLIIGSETDHPKQELPSEMNRLKALVKQRNLNTEVLFLGGKNRDQLKYYYNSANIFVTVPWYDPFGITPIEAMACGTPVIGSNVGGIQFAVKDKVTGFLIPPKDSHTLGKKLFELYQNPHQLKIFGKASLLRSHQFFQWNIISKSTLALYEKVLNSRRTLHSPALLYH